MKKKILILLFIALNFQIFAQFSITVEESVHFIPTSFSYGLKAIETDNNEYFISYSTNGIRDDLHFLKLDSDGNILMEKELDTIIDDKRFFYKTGISIINDRLIVLGTLRLYDNSDASSCILELDENLDYLRHYCLPDIPGLVNRTSFDPSSFLLKNKRGNYIFESYCSDSFFSKNEKSSFPRVLYEINSDFTDTIQTKVFNPIDLDYVSYMYEKENGNYLLLNRAGITTIDTINISFGSEIVEIDSSFNILSDLYFHDIINPGYNNFFMLNTGHKKTTGKTLNDTSFLLSFETLSNNEPFEGQLGIAVIDTSLQEINKNRFGDLEPELGDDDNSSSSISIHKNLDFTDPNNIFQVGFTGFNVSLGFPMVPNHIMINIVNEELNLKSQHFYGGDSCIYEVSEVLATQDGGCLISAIKYVIDQDYYIIWSGLHILKVNEYGTLEPVNNEKINNSTTKLAFIYPNPSKDFINVRYGAHLKNVSIEIFDISGKKILFKNLEKSVSRIDIQNLKIGSYVYHILSHNKIIESEILIIN